MLLLLSVSRICPDTFPQIPCSAGTTLASYSKSDEVWAVSDFPSKGSWERVKEQREGRRTKSG